MSIPPATQVVVIGAGQAGLSVAYYLQRLGLTPGTDFVVLDRGPGTGGAWQHRWESLRIGSAHRINDLPGMSELELSFDDADRTLPARDVVADYYRRYEEFYGLQVFRPYEVHEVFNRGTELVVGHRRVDAPDARVAGDRGVRRAGAAGTGNRVGAEHLPSERLGEAGQGQGQSVEPDLDSFEALLRAESDGSDEYSEWSFLQEALADEGEAGTGATAASASGRSRLSPGVAGEIVADVVVNATGTWGAPFIPWYPGADRFEGRHLHTVDYASAEELRDKKVVVVGGGTSAIGFVMELEGIAGHVTWVSRRPIDFLEQGELNLEARSAAVAMQDEAARAGRALPSIVSGTGVPRTRRIQAAIDRGVLTPRPMFESFEPHGVRWADGSSEPVDAIVWATGFRPELRHLAPLKLREKAGGVTVGQGSSWKDPRIFFAGYGPQASTIGANRAGRMIARQVVAQLAAL